MWKDLNPADLSREYSPSSCAPDFAQVLACYRGLSDDALATYGAQVVPYGERPQEQALLFQASNNGTLRLQPPPLLIYLHGGYWQELSARDSCFAAVAALARGVCYAAVDYTLAPGASVAQIVAQCARAVACLRRQHLQAHPGAVVVVAGSSAGAHLAAMLCTVGLHQGEGRDGSAVQVDGAVLLSGIYDLQPLVTTYVNDKLGLDGAEARCLSPQFLAATSTVPTLVCWGEYETHEFKRQSREYAARLRANGQLAGAYEVPGANHFDIVFGLCDPASRLGRDTLALLKATTP